VVIRSPTPAPVESFQPLESVEGGASEAIQLPHHDDVHAPPLRCLEQLPPSASATEVRSACVVDILTDKLIVSTDRRP
jgi:hypothetical protein